MDMMGEIQVHVFRQSIRRVKGMSSSQADMKYAKEKKKLRRQRKPSLHQLRKRRHIGSKSRVSPSPEDERGVNVDRVGFRQNAAPGHQYYDECFYFQWHVW
eukprot:1158500-Pelagomonas_calceolata.AAC.13